MPRKDRYDRAVEYLTAHPEEIEGAWQRPADHEAGCLFQMVTKIPATGDGTGVTSVCAVMEAGFGCLTQVKSGFRCAESVELTRMIREAEDIPASDTGGQSPAKTLPVSSLPAFARWNRIIDRKLGRKWPRKKAAR